ncbi:hypothetical protein D3C78_1899580 [compost metagenome]
MLPAQVDLHVAGYRTVGANAQRRTLIPVVHFGHAVGADADLVLRVALAEFFLGTVQFRRLGRLAQQAAQSLQQ